MSKSITLPGNQELQFVSDSWEKTVTVYLFDTISDTRVTLTEFYNGRWNPKARNGSHYGLGQMRSTWYRDLSPKKQIDAHIKYLRHMMRLLNLMRMMQLYFSMASMVRSMYVGW